MGTVAANFLPNATGLDLGSPGQQWDAFIRNLTAATFTSGALNPALTGTIRLASGDTINWRNFANSGDLVLQKQGAASGNRPADTFNFQSGGGGMGGVQATLLSNTTDNMATAGAVRLCASDAIEFRNNTNSADVTALSLNGSNQTVLGDSNGISIPGAATFTGAIVASSFSATTGSFTTPSGTAMAVQPGGTVGSATNVLGGNAAGGTNGGSVNITGTNGVGANGGNITLTGGNSTTSATGGNINLVPGTGASTQGNVVLNGTTVITKIGTYAGNVTFGNGIASLVAGVNLTAQTAAVGTTTLYTTVAAGQYRLTWNAKITTTATTGAATSTLGGLTIAYTDPDGVTLTCAASGQLGLTGALVTTSAANTTGTVIIGFPMLLNCKAATNVTYAMGYASNTANQMAYNLNIRLEAM